MARSIEVNPATLTSGLAAAVGGDEVLLRAGKYGQIAPPKSGVQGQPIVIRSYPGEEAVVANLSDKVALSLIGRSDIVIEGIKVQNVLGFGRLEDSSRITIQNLTFKDCTSTGTTGGLKLVRSSHNRILKNRLENGNDSLILQDNSDRNVVLENTFTNARHSLLSIRCSNYNVIRGNSFGNPSQKAVEIYDCEGVSDAPVRLNAAKRNLFEGNAFRGTAASTSDYKYNAIQHGAQYTVVRRNVVYDCLGGGFNYQYYSDESLYVYGNRMYNNTFYANRCYGIIGNSGTTSRYYDNRVSNNLLYKNVACDGRAIQTRISNPSLVILANNALATQDPKFVSETGQDFRLSATSPSINAGAFVTKTAQAGTGTSLQVLDASYFYDGYGITGELGDLIQLEGQELRARITAIDYATNTLTIDRPLTWNAGQGVHLAYTGSAPDVGAYEYGLETGIQPSPPKNLRLPK
jgi:parallel beta-helix repeat protein